MTRAHSLSGLRAAFQRLGVPLLLCLLPVIVLILVARADIPGHNLGVDFRGELYPEARLVVHDHDPFPAPDADLSHGINRIFPVPAALLVSPFTLLSVNAATLLFCALLVIALAATLRLLGVTDWRVYGVVLLWAPTISALQTANLTIILALLVAVAWRFRERRFVPGVAIGLAIALKLFLWPLALLLLVQRRFAAAVVAGCLTLAGTLLVLPFVTLSDYVRLMQNMSDTFGPGSYDLNGLLIQSGVADAGNARLVAYAAGLAVLALALARRSLGLTVFASLMLSPIVWLHYFVLLVVPISLRWPRLATAWFIPLLFWVCPGNAIHVRAHHILIALIVVATVAAISEWRRPAPTAVRLESAM